MNNPRNIKVNSKIFYITDLTDPNSIKIGTVTKLNENNLCDLIFIDNQHKAEDCIYASYCYPINVLGEMTDIILKRAELKKAFDDSITLIYILNNAIDKGERN